MSTILQYSDPVEGFPGWLVYDGASNPLAAGGCRMQPGLTVDTVAELASRMTLKQRLLGVGVDGAKCGIDYDPRAPGRVEALRRFLDFMRDELMTRFSMGCDMGTQWSELEQLARRLGVPSIKYAIRSAQGFTDDEFFARLRLLDQPVGLLTLGQRRAGHALAHAVLTTARAIGIRRQVRCALQGFGNLGRAAAYSLLEEGAVITAISDEYGCATAPHGLDVAAMLTTPYGTPVPKAARHATYLRADRLFEVPADVIVLAAGEEAFHADRADVLDAPAVVVGANCGLRPPVEDALHRRGIVVIPDFVGGIGGSGSMEALFGPPERPTAQAVLYLVAGMMHTLVGHLIELTGASTTVRSSALDVAAQAPDGGGSPYGRSPYLSSLASM